MTNNGGLPTGSSARPRVSVHIGAAKSGTTYLQSRLWFNRRLLRQHGFCYPGERLDAHFWAALDVRGARFRGVRAPEVEGAWAQLVTELAGAGLPGVIDHELLAPATAEQVARIVDDLSFAEVHVVWTLRDIGRTLPAAWQERVKNREVDDFAAFLRAVHEPPGGRSKTSREFWALHDTPRILGRWADVVPPDRVHVVTVPPPGADRSGLWTRFATAIGLDRPADYEDRTLSNRSLPAAEATLLRRLNAEVSDLPWPAYEEIVKLDLAVALAERDGPALGLPTGEREWLAEWTDRVTEFITDRGFDVVGDLADLSPAVSPDGIDPDAVDAAPQLDAAVEALATLVRRLATGARAARDAEIEDLRGELDAARRQLEAARQELDAAHGRADQSRGSVTHQLRRRLRR